MKSQIVPKQATICRGEGLGLEWFPQKAKPQQAGRQMKTLDRWLQATFGE
jgi:hypothetical protein